MGSSLSWLEWEGTRITGYIQFFGQPSSRLNHPVTARPAEGIEAVRDFKLYTIHIAFSLTFVVIVAIEHYIMVSYCPRAGSPFDRFVLSLSFYSNVTCSSGEHCDHDSYLIYQVVLYTLPLAL